MVMVFDRLKASVALFTTGPVPRVPVVPPAPTCSEPSPMVVVPE